MQQHARGWAEGRYAGRRLVVVARWITVEQRSNHSRIETDFHRIIRCRFLILTLLHVELEYWPQRRNTNHDFIARHHAMHTQRDVRLSVCPMPVLCLKRMDLSSHFLTIWQGHHSSFYSPDVVTKFQENPLAGALRWWERFGNIALYLGNGRIEGSLLSVAYLGFHRGGSNPPFPPSLPLPLSPSLPPYPSLPPSLASTHLPSPPLRSRPP